MSVVLYGYQYSVYTWVARLALAVKGVAHETVETDPFSPDAPESYRAIHPFTRVPALVHDGFALFETAAITRYIDEAFPGPALQPDDARARARMTQIVSIVDSYGYWPLVRQVFSHGVFRPLMGRPVDAGELRAGLAAAPRVLAALDRLVSVGGITLADLHLAPMIAYFSMAPEGAAELGRCSRLAAWWEAMRRNGTVIETWPKFPAGDSGPA